LGVLEVMLLVKKEAIDCIRSYAPNFIFTTSIPPAVAAAARESLKIISEK